MKSLIRFNPKRQQHGAALILLVFILAIAMTTYLVKTVNSDRLKVDEEQKQLQNLAKAKEALISWAVTNSLYPGQMPYPDRGTDGNYDGFSDCPMSGTPFNNPLSYRLLIGKLPVYGQTNPCIVPQVGLGLDVKGEDGKRLWYAVSRNLVHQYEYLTNDPLSNPIINSSIVNNPTHPWLRVLDKNGVVISDRVAAVLIAPGDVIGNQVRSNTATVDNFLDQFQIGSTIYSNRDYDQSDEDFIMGQSLEYLSDNDLSYTRPYLFNDKLIYITIEELIAALEKRVGETVRQALNVYHANNGGVYPYAAHLGTSLSYASDGNLQRGFLPLFQECSLNVATQTFNCRQPIFDVVVSGITNIKFVLPSPQFISSTGSCTNTGTECDCNGAGSCTASSFTFVCGSEGKTCSLTGTLGVSALLEVQGGNLVTASGSCSIGTALTLDANGCPVNGSANAVCDPSAGNGFVAAYSNSDAPLTLPEWFVANQWQRHVYYEMTRPASSSITVGGTNIAEAIVVTVGPEIVSVPFAVSKGAAQMRPSCNILSEYLDSAENANNDSVYDATYKQRSNNYNDQIFVVRP